MSKTTGRIGKLFGTKWSLGDPLPRLLKLIWSFKKHGCQGAESVFPTYVGKIQKSSCQKLLGTTWHKSSFGDPLPRLIKFIWSVEKYGCQGTGPVFLCVYRKNIKNILVKNYWADLEIIWHKLSLCDLIPGLLKIFDLLKTWLPGVCIPLAICQTCFCFWFKW